MQYVYLIYPILFTRNSKLVDSSTGFAPKEARDASNELEAYAHMQLKATRNRNYPENSRQTQFMYIHEAKDKSKVSSLIIV